MFAGVTTHAMLSILIPTFNFDCTPLVQRLAIQARTLDTPTEIVVADDGSADPAAVRALDRLPADFGVRLVRPPHNLGRAAIRNFLGREARGEWLLFLDSDGLPPNPDFLARYAPRLTEKADVVCGGIVHPDRCPSPAVALRYRYEKAAETRFTVARRNEHPYGAFRSFNFAIRRPLFLAVGFDESFRRYGYEDVLFGQQLARRGARVVHINNPLLNTDLEANTDFLRKTEEALHTLADHCDQLGPHVRLHARLAKLRRAGLTRSLRLAYRTLAPQLRRQLTGSHPSVFLFNVYKLLYLNQLL